MVWLLEFVAPYTEPNMIPEFNSTCVTLNLGEPTKKNGEILYYKVHLCLRYILLFFHLTTYKQE